MPTTIEVRFKGIRKGYFRWEDAAATPRLREAVVVQAERGVDLGRVTALGASADQKCGGCDGCTPATGSAPSTEYPAVVRLATSEDVRQAEELRRQEEAIRHRVTERALVHHLAMRVSDAEWQWDRKKLTVYFTAEQRVDFRALVRELAGEYRTRIELRQIGARDEAARIGGVGRCGREYCCSTWLTDLSPVSLSLAKDQHLSLNPAQISGGCGRLLCCLRYEHEFYVAARKRFPKEGRTLTTARGPEKVMAVDIFRERVFLRGAEGPRTVLLADLALELEQTGAPASPPVPAPAPAPAAAAPSPPPEAADAAGPVGEAPAKPRRRRRRRRGRGGGSAPPPPNGA